MNVASKIYVAGHRGMVGSAIVRKLHAAGYENILARTHAELDLRRQADVEQFFEAERPEIVFLAAAKVGGIVANNTYRAEFIHDNLAIALNVISAAHRFGVGKLLNLGSSCIYPKHAPQPMCEEHLLTGELEPTNEPYAVAKIAAIKLCSAFNAQYGTDFISVMPTNLYGERDNFNLETAHVLPALIRKFELARHLAAGDFDALRDDLMTYRLGFGRDEELILDVPGPIESALASFGITRDMVTLWGTGSPRREFLHAGDLADAALYLMEHHDHRSIGEFVNVGTGEDLPIAELAALIAELVGFNGAIHWDSTRPDGTPRKLLEVSRLAALGWRARIGLREGLLSAIAWYRRSVREATDVRGTAR